MIPATTTGPPLAAADTPRLRRRLLMATWYIVAAVWGVRGLYADAPSLLDLLSGALLGCALYWWAAEDSAARGRPFPRLVRDWVFIAFLGGHLLTLAVYAIWSRRWRGILFLAVHAVGLTAAAWAGALIVWLILP